jgi:hypothetical protein
LRETLLAAPSRDADPAPATLATLEHIAVVAPEQAMGADVESLVTGAAYGD